MIKYFFLLLTLICSSITNAQNKVYFSMFELLNVHGDYQYSTSKLLKSYVNNLGNYELIIPERGESAPAGSVSGTRQLAQELGTPYFLVGEMNALQEVLIVSITLYSTTDGKIIWSDLLKANGLDDLDPIMLLISKSIGTKYKASEMEDIYSVTSYDATELGKKESTSSYGIYIGGVYTFLPNVDRNFSSGFGGKITYDARTFILDVNGDLIFGDINIYDINLSALYPFKKDTNTPFLGGGLGYGGHSVKTIIFEDPFGYGYHDRERSVGLLFYLHAGYLINRTSNVQMRGTVTAYTATYQVDTHTPAGLAFNLTFSF